MSTTQEQAERLASLIVRPGIDRGSPNPEALEARIAVLIATALRDAEAAQRERDARIAFEFAEHYPTDIFIEPPPGQHGQTVDACSARAIRHAVQLIGSDILRGQE